MLDQDEGFRLPPSGKFYMTPLGNQGLQTELLELKTTRHRVVEVVAWAASNGDRSENADYKEGKRRLREIDARLHFLSHRLRNAEVVDPSQQENREQVFFGATVRYETENERKITVTIVGTDEANMSQGKISIGSPVALALLGARKDSEVVVRTPRGPEIILVLAISYPECNQQENIKEISSTR